MGLQYYDGAQGGQEGWYYVDGSGTWTLSGHNDLKKSFDARFGTHYGGFNYLPYDVQLAMMQNPDVFAAGNTGWNQENNSVLSVGAEGGYTEDAYRNAQWDPQRGLILDPNQYLQIHAEGAFGNLVDPLRVMRTDFVKGYAELDPVTKGGMKAAQGGAQNLDRGEYLDPLGAVASFTGSEETQPIDWGANPLTAQQGGDTLEAARLGGKIMAGYGLATAAGAGSGAASTGTEVAPYGGFDNAAIAGADYGVGSAAAGGTTGGSSMWDFIDGDYGSFDYGGESMYSPDYGETGAFDQFGWSSSPDGSGVGDIMADGYSSPFQWSDLTQYGRSALPFVRNLLAGGSGPGGTQGRSILDGIFGDPLGAAFNMTPFLLALAEGNRQKNDIRDITNKLGDLEQEASTANVQSMVLTPYDRETAMGRERLVNSLGQRNVLGSSFGNQDLTAFDTTRMQGRGDLATKALMGSIGTRGALLDQVLQGTNKMNTNKNLLLGAGLNASGSLFQPERKADPFGLQALLGL